MSSSATSQSREQHVTPQEYSRLAPLELSCLWGGMLRCRRQSFANIPPVTLGLLRLLIGGITLSILLWFANRRQSKPAATSLSQHARKRLPWLGVCIASASLRNPCGANLATAHEASLLHNDASLIIPNRVAFAGERPRILVCIGVCTPSCVPTIRETAWRRIHPMHTRMRGRSPAKATRLG